jgi:hypothetical protein
VPERFVTQDFDKTPTVQHSTRRTVAINRQLKAANSTLHESMDTMVIGYDTLLSKHVGLEKTSRRFEAATKRSFAKSMRLESMNRDLE